MKILFDRKQYIWEPNIVDQDPNSCLLTVETDDELGTIVITPINPPTRYQLTVNEITDKTRLVKITYTLTDSRGNESLPQYEYFLIIKQATVINNYGYYATLDDLLKYVSKEELLYHDILISSDFKKCSYNNLLTSEDIDFGSNVIYDKENSYFQGSPGSYIIDTIVQDEDSFNSFMIHVDSDDSLDYSIQYTTDWSSWYSIDNNTKIDLDHETTSIVIRITWESSGKIYGIGAFYGRAKLAPVIDSINWDKYTHYAGLEYVMSIVVPDYNINEIDSNVTCNDSNVIISKLDHTSFKIKYPSYSGITAIRFNIKVFDNEGRNYSVFYDTIVNI